MPDASTMDLARLYGRRFAVKERRHKQRLWDVLVQDWLQRYIRETDTVLDVAGGLGEFIRAVRCGRKLLVDLHPPQPGELPGDVTALQGSTRDLGGVGSGSVDVVLASNIFEHLRSTEELLESLREISRVLRGGGRLLILQPNIRFAYREYWDFLDHHLPLSDRGLAEALEHEGFVVEQCVPQFLPYSTKSRLPQAPWVVRLYLRLPWLWRVFGRQLFMVARRSA